VTVRLGGAEEEGRTSKRDGRGRLGFKGVPGGGGTVVMKVSIECLRML